MSAKKDEVRKIQLVAREAVVGEILEKYPFPTPNHKAVIELLYRETIAEMKQLGLERV
jgi:hypothetical protein